MFIRNFIDEILMFLMIFGLMSCTTLGKLSKKHKLGQISSAIENKNSSSSDSLSHPSLAAKIVNIKLRICKKRSTLEGGGLAKLVYPGSSPQPPSMLDFIYKSQILKVEVTDLLGAKLFGLAASKKDAKFYHLSSVIPDSFHNNLDLKVNSKGLLVLSGNNLGVSAEELACLLTFGIPSDWDRYKTSVKYDKEHNKTSWRFSLKNDRSLWR